MQPGAARFGALGPCSAEASRHPALQPVARPLSALQHLCSVLLVDDDPHRWIPLVRALREQGHRVLHAADGPSGESLCRASRFEIDALIAEADKFRKDDQEHREIRELQNRLEGLLYTNERVVREFGAGLSTDDREEVRATLNRARKALTSEERSVLEEAIYAVQDAAQILTHVIVLDPVAALGGELKMNPDAPGGDVLDADSEGEPQE